MGMDDSSLSGYYWSQLEQLIFSLKNPTKQQSSTTGFIKIIHRLSYIFKVYHATQDTKSQTFYYICRADVEWILNMFQSSVQYRLPCAKICLKSSERKNRKEIIRYFNVKIISGREIYSVDSIKEESDQSLKILDHFFYLFSFTWYFCFNVYGRSIISLFVKIFQSVSLAYSSACES